MEGGKEPLFDAQELAQGKPELGREYGASVAENGVGQTVVSNYSIEDDFYQREYSYYYLHILVVYHFC